MIFGNKRVNKIIKNSRILSIFKHLKDKIFRTVCTVRFWISLDPEKKDITKKGVFSSGWKLLSKYIQNPKAGEIPSGKLCVIRYLINWGSDSNPEVKTLQPLLNCQFILQVGATVFHRFPCHGILVLRFHEATSTVNKENLERPKKKSTLNPN